jgi:hypothetical protein
MDRCVMQTKQRIYMLCISVDATLARLWCSVSLGLTPLYHQDTRQLTLNNGIFIVKSEIHSL